MTAMASWIASLALAVVAPAAVPTTNAAARPATAATQPADPGAPPESAAMDPAVVAAAREKIDRFVAAVAADPNITQAARTTIADAWRRRRAEGDPRGFLEEALAVVSPGFRQALDAMGEQKYADAETTLRPLAESKDVYVAVHAASMLARVLIEQEKIDASLKLLDAWREREADVDRYSFQGPEMDFMRAYALLRSLKYDLALAVLEAFVRDRPDAPERLRLTARQMLQELRRRRPGQVGDVADLMAYAGRQLGLGLADRPVTEAQEKAVDLLQRLIREAEQNEQQGQGGSDSRGGRPGNRSGQPRGTQPPNAPADRSTLPEGTMPDGTLRRSPVARPGDMWGQMPAGQREKILQTLRRSFPQRYRELVEQYYKQLGKQD